MLKNQEEYEREAPTQKLHLPTPDMLYTIFRDASQSASYTSQNIDCSCKPDSN